MSETICTLTGKYRERHCREVLVLTRRQLLEAAGGGFGLLGLASLLHCEGLLEKAASGSEGDDVASRLAQNPMQVPRPGHLPAKARSQCDLFFAERRAQPCRHLGLQAHRAVGWQVHYRIRPVFRANTTGSLQGRGRGLMKSPFRFSRAANAARWCQRSSQALGQYVDKMAFIHSGINNEQSLPALFHDEHRSAAWAIRASAHG